ncbi:hypothetical protein M885DRAFT_512729 [Pelagophyceae sp. CCMP2097]|nr:hypothetical protein M885DRAFT_512729 [Pelagophyceae sp. CCMP2097]
MLLAARPPARRVSPGALGMLVSAKPHSVEHATVEVALPHLSAANPERHWRDCKTWDFEEGFEVSPTPEARVPATRRTPWVMSFGLTRGEARPRGNGTVVFRAVDSQKPLVARDARGWRRSRSDTDTAAHPKPSPRSRFKPRRRRPEIVCRICQMQPVPSQQSPSDPTPKRKSILKEARAPACTAEAAVRRDRSIGVGMDAADSDAAPNARGPRRAVTFSATVAQHRFAGVPAEASAACWFTGQDMRSFVDAERSRRRTCDIHTNTCITSSVRVFSRDFREALSRRLRNSNPGTTSGSKN